MDIETAYLNFLTALDEVPNVLTLGPSYFSTMNNWTLPAITVDVDNIAIGTTSEDASSIDATGLMMPVVIHTAIRKDSREAMRTMLSDSLTILRQIIPIFIASFPDYALNIADVWCAVVQFGKGRAFGFGFTLTVSSQLSS